MKNIGGLIKYLEKRKKIYIDEDNNKTSFGMFHTIIKGITDTIEIFTKNETIVVNNGIKYMDQFIKGGKFLSNYPPTVYTFYGYLYAIGVEKVLEWAEQYEINKNDLKI